MNSQQLIDEHGEHSRTSGHNDEAADNETPLLGEQASPVGGKSRLLLFAGPPCF